MTVCTVQYLLTAKLHIASLLRTGITLKIQIVQFQKGASVCGAYVIAFATDLAYGNNPASREYEQTKLRSHFLECLSKKTDCSISIETNKAREAQIRVHIYILHMSYVS